MPKPSRAPQASNRAPLVIATVIAVVLLSLTGVYVALFASGAAKRAVAVPVAGQIGASVEASQQLAVFAQAAYAVISYGNQPMTIEQIVASGQGGSGLDPWGKLYRFNRDPATKRVWYSSDGPDMVEGTVDDIESSKVP